MCGLLQLLACALDSVFEVLDCADDVFALGSTSSIVATELASLSWAKTRRKVLQFCSFIYCYNRETILKIKLDLTELQSNVGCLVMDRSQCGFCPVLSTFTR